MATDFSPFAGETWSHDWRFDVQSQFGDPDEDPEFGCVATILADSPEQAERRTLIYVPANFDDPTMPLRAEAEPTPVAPGTYRVKVIWRGAR